MDINALNAYFKTYIEDLSHWLPEGLIFVDLFLLNEFGLLDFQEENTLEKGLTRYFQVAETEEKIILMNDSYVIWIYPENLEKETATFVLIALNQPAEPKLELAFCVAGVYNTSKLVLGVLEKFLEDIDENENSLKALDEG